MMPSNILSQQAQNRATRSPIREGVLKTTPVGVTFVVLTQVIWLSALVVGFANSLWAFTIFGFVSAMIGLRNPLVGVIGVGVLCTVDALTRVYLLTGGLLRWNSFNYWLLVVILTSLPMTVRFKSVQFRLLVALVVVLLFGLSYSIDLEIGIQNTLGAVSCIGILVYFLRLRNLLEEGVIWLGVVCGLLSSTGGLVYFLLKSTIPEINYNALSYFPLTGLFCSCLALRFSRRMPKVHAVLVGAILINAVWTFLTTSRGGAFVAAAGLLFLLTEIRGLSQTLVLTGFGLVFLSWVASEFVDLGESSSHRFDKMFDSQNTLVERTSGRSDLAAAGFRIFLENPFGIGTGSFAKTYSRLSYEQDLAFGRGTERAAHSAWVKTMAENGLFGIPLLAAFVFSFFWRGWTSLKRGSLAFGFWISLSLSVAFLSTEFQSKGLWILAAGGMAIMGSGKLNRDNRPIRARGGGVQGR